MNQAVDARWPADPAPTARHAGGRSTMVNDKSSEKAPATTRIRMRIMVGTIILGVALAVGLFALGCGAKSDRQAAVAPSDQVYTVSQPGGGQTPTRTAA